jgi:hypothetical protein
MQIIRITIGLLVLVALGASGAASERDGNASAAFDRLKSLVGEWRTDDGKDGLVYELIAGGTALLERETSSSRPAMVTLYHRDGERLLLTHYCMAGNQPRMAAKPFDPKTGELAFEFLDATNLKAPGAGHMRDVRIRFIDANHIESEWRFYENGQPKMTERARYARVR